MAAQYDAFGNYLGDWETEEERRKREEEIANTAVRTQEIKTYGDGTVERVTKEEVPGAAVAPVAQPMAPAPRAIVAQPVVPDQMAYNAAIQQQESGARPNIGFHNQQLSSAYGPYGITAGAYADARKANPNLPADITQATPEQMNQAQNAVTQNNAKYLQSYGVEVNPNTLSAAHFLGAKGLADYLRDGTISDAAARANGGAENVKRIVDQRLGGQAAPASGAAQAPAAAVSPEELARREQYSLATGQTGMGLQASGVKTSMPAGSATSSAPFINAYQSAQDNPMNLLKLRNDENVPEWIRERAGDRAYELMNMEVQKKQAQEQAKVLATAAAMGDRKAGNTIAKELQNQDGSWLKMILLGFISPQLAGEEAIKLGFGNKWVSGQDEKGNQAMIQVNAKGLPLKGYTADGNEIATNDLVAYATGGSKKLNIVGGTYVNDKTGEVGRVITDERTGQSYIQTDSGRKPMTGFRPQSSTGTLEDMRTRTIQDINLKLRGKGVEESMGILRDYNKQLVGAGYAPVQPSEVGITVPQIGGAPAAAPATPAPAVPGAGMAAEAAQGRGPQLAAPGGPVVPGQVPAGRPTAAQIAAQTKTAEEIAKEAGKVVAVSAETQNLLNGIKKATDIIDSGDHNIGSVLSAGVGRGPIAQAIGSQFETKDARNTKTVMDTVQKLATEGLKALGSNPSTADLQFWTRFKPDASSDPEFVKEWIESRSEDLKRRLGYAEKQVEKGGQAGAAPEVKTESTMSPADRARAELERRRKEKK